MRRYLLIIVTLGIFVAWFVWPGPYERHFDFPIPSTAQLDKYDAVGMGFDAFYAFRFTFTDDQFRDQIIKSWNLRESNDPDNELTSFVSLKPPKWWPVANLQLMDERYGREIRKDERCWSVWIDRHNNYLYAEYGKW